MNITLNCLLEQIGTAHQHRYGIDEIAHILGMTKTEVLNRIKRRHLPAVKVSERKWGYVLHDDLAAYVAQLNVGAL